MLGIVRGSVCPRCGSSTHRTHTPLALKLVRALIRNTITLRCNSRDCRWRGLAYKPEGAERRRRRESA